MLFAEHSKSWSASTGCGISFGVHRGLEGRHRGAGLSTIYSALFLSSSDGLFHYSDTDAKTLIENILACFGCVAMVHHLRLREIQKAKEGEQRDIVSLALAESDRRFRETMDAAPVLLWVSDVHGNRTFFNRQWLTFTGQTTEQQTGNGWQALVHPDDRWSLGRYSAAVKSCDRFELEYRTARGKRGVSLAAGLRSALDRARRKSLRLRRRVRR